VKNQNQINNNKEITAINTENYLKWLISMLSKDATLCNILFTNKEGMNVIQLLMSLYRYVLYHQWPKALSYLNTLFLILTIFARNFKPANNSIINDKITIHTTMQKKEVKLILETTIPNILEKLHSPQELIKLDSTNFKYWIDVVLSSFLRDIWAGLDTPINYNSIQQLLSKANKNEANIVFTPQYFDSIALK